MKLLIILGISFFLIGCVEKECVPVIKVQNEIKYINQSIPDISKPPKAIEYSSSLIKYNDETYFKLSITDGLILKNNYEQFKIWAYENYKILLKLKEKDK